MRVLKSGSGSSTAFLDHVVYVPGIKADYVTINEPIEHFSQGLRCGTESIGTKAHQKIWEK